MGLPTTSLSVAGRILSAKGILKTSVFSQECLDLFVRVDNVADGGIVVDGSDEVREVLGNVNFLEPRALEQLRRTIGQVGAEYAVDKTLLICFVELCDTFVNIG